MRGNRLTAHAAWHIYDQSQTPLRLKVQKFCKDVVTNRGANVIQEFAGGLNSKVGGDFMETEITQKIVRKVRLWSDKKPCNLGLKLYWIFVYLFHITTDINLIFLGSDSQIIFFSLSTYFC